MARPSKPDIPPLPPLEYCRIERATRLLGCETEDLIHWAAIGAIDIFADAGKANAYTPAPLIFAAPEVYPIGLVHDASYELLPHAKLSEEPYHPYPIGNDELKPAEISGFWSVGLPRQLEMYLSGMYENHTDGHIAMFLTCQNEDRSNKVAAMVSIDSLENNLWLMREDLQFLHDHIHTGEPLRIKGNHVLHQLVEIDKHVIGKTPHPTAERHAVNRESVLAAAIHIKHQWPKECGDTARQWAEQLDLHAHQYWSDGLPPLSREAIERLLSSAMKDGKPHKKS